MQTARVKWLWIIVGVFLCYGIFQTNAWALTYVDDFTDTENNNIKQYVNLMPFAMTASYYQTLPDRTVFSFASKNAPFGYATYQVRNAETITVGFYTTQGSFVQQSADGQWILGTLEEMDLDTLPNVEQALYSKTEGAVYTKKNGGYYKLHFYYGNGQLQAKAFLPMDHVGFNGSKNIPDDLSGYGANVYASSNNSSWTYIPLTYTKQYFQSSSPFVYEEMSAKLPLGTRYVRVELNDLLTIPYVGAGSGYQQILPNRMNTLASVVFVGENLMMGEPENYVEQPILPNPIELLPFSMLESESESESEVEPKSILEDESESESESEVEPESTLEDESDSESEPEPESESDDESDSEPESKSESESEKSSTGSSGTKSSSSKSSSNSSKASSSKSTTTSTSYASESSKSQTKSEPYSAPKFEGVIVSSSSTPSSKNSEVTPSSTQSAVVNSAKWSGESLASSVEAPSSELSISSVITTTYEVPAKDDENGRDRMFTIGISVYVVIVTSVLIFMLLCPYFKK